MTGLSNFLKVPPDVAYSTPTSRATFSARSDEWVLCEADEEEEGSIGGGSGRWGGGGVGVWGGGCGESKRKKMQTKYNTTEI